MNDNKFKKHMKVKMSTHDVDRDAYRISGKQLENFLKEKPTREQFNRFLTHSITEADHLWVLTQMEKK